MSEIKDDPREVLVLLNSLGFVGITAIQLKAFMKDLKIYRKVKEREKQQRKEEIKTKIIDKHEALLNEAYRYCNIRNYSSSNNIPSESSNSFENESIKVRIRCIPKEDVNQKHSKVTTIESDKKLSTQYSEKDTEPRIQSKQNYADANYPIIKSSKDSDKQIDTKCLAQEHVASSHISSNRTNRTELKSAMSDPSGNVGVQSTLSRRSSVNFGHKSFIRPWRLQSDAQKHINKKCDPVALYQKYQQEWKHISFPGEAKHSKIRWAVREKMLGTDPHPLPLSKKSTQMPILKKK
ncbi:hypothetical protein PUN28_019593 [Cardiocondyla obscurior]|uniref:Centriolar and ciliogenesis-associated protein HYLS1 C-terminal domain-containing protein n=1 Tax=Cardiocondyla obscurior TaxID=286306 RepID=A0AAW2EFB2_9HYME